MKKTTQVFAYLIISLLSFSTTWAQNKSKTLAKRPALVVGIVVDQMRYDYLYKYQDRYSDNGFKRLMREGLNCQDNHYNYAPTVTAAGHASVYTGTVPAVHGIVGNDWTDVATGKKVYCTEDSTVTTVGTTGKTGFMSPKNLWTSTITDQLRISQNFRSKTIAIALKDRGAILPGGHTANGSYWYDSKEGRWITSTFYMKELPSWVQKFNAEEKALKYVKQGWNTLYPIDTYVQSAEDNLPFEGKLPSEKTPTFPHALEGPNPLEIIRSTPYGNSITKDFALKAIEEEKLGQNNNTDFLAVSFSSTDYVGHAFGPQSIELEDTYLRLDRDIAEILSYLDKQFGKDRVLVFLTADHAVAEVPGYLQSKKMPGGVFEANKALTEAKSALQKEFGSDKLIIGSENSQLYIDHSLVEKLAINRKKLHQVILAAYSKIEGTSTIIDMQDVANSTLIQPYKDLVTNGYNPARSGDFMILLKPQWFMGGKTGTTHSTLYAYDTHVPLLFYGWKVKPQELSSRTSISDISTTLANWLGCMEPSGSIGKIIPIAK
ncbi:Alkaline phosphatase [Aquirufa nivalisilvae]|uniref:Alkaline phosphatase n=1 Tax=Aquirufa nivalisilvae TaxID=2516557 RepID=A0A2S2DW57_9BACT|nr:alkaline phosphatase PafA [Aquirufa nivalisilvae]AWL09559.1 Alkaline phosphatase [Aquirufa nivalisilvae]MCZ2480914.1 alkaline phosphatase family protein [Aquirufa nivalisilvae]